MKTKNSILNFITEVIPLILITFIGLFKSKLLVSQLSINSVGLYQLYSQLLGYVTIFEFGMTGALLYRFFAPVNKKDQKRINILFTSGNRVFSIIAIIMLFISIIFTLFIPMLIKDNPFSYVYILITFLMYVSTNIIYYLVVSYKVLLEAEEKRYITNLIIQIFEIIKSILEIICLLVFKNLIALLSVGIVTTIMSSIFIIVVCKKYNPKLKKTKEKDYSMLSDVKNLFVHKIAFLVNNNVDLILVTKIMGLSQVVVYSMYNYITSSLKKITSRIYVSIVPSLGNLLVEDNKKAIGVFYEVNNFMFYLATVITTSLVICFNGFINIWYDGQIYTSYIYALGFSIVFFANIVMQPLIAFTDAGGCFKETKKCAILEATINLGLSLVLIKPFGMFGILLATFIGYTVADNIIRAKVICNNLLNTSVKRYYKNLIFYYIVPSIMIFVEYFLLNNINYSNILSWLLISCLIFCVNTIITSIIFKVFNKLDFMDRIKKLFKRKVVSNEKN